MSNHKIVFYGNDSFNAEHELTVQQVDNVEVIISIDMKTGHQFGLSTISLDKATAVKFVRVMKAEISKLEA